MVVAEYKEEAGMRRAKGATSADRESARKMRGIVSSGVLSLIMYLAIFLNQDLVTRYFTSGGVFSLVIVATALAFALVHGTFASHVLENLRFKAANQQEGGH